MSRAYCQQCREPVCGQDMQDVSRNGRRHRCGTSRPGSGKGGCFGSVAVTIAVAGAFAAAVIRRAS